MTDDGPDPFTNLFEAPAKFARALFAPMAEAAGGNPLSAEDMRHWAEVGTKLQTMWLEYQAEQLADPQALVPWMDPARWMGLAQDWYRQMPLADPAQQQALWQEGMEVWQQVLAQYGLGAGGQEEARDAADMPRRDRRFADPRWRAHPAYALIHQTYLFLAERVAEMVDRIDGLSDDKREQLRFTTRTMTDAASPANFPLLNPVVMERTLETQGENLVTGMEHLLADLRRGQLSHTDASAFTLGENIAVTPGKVVHETPLYQLIQYTPTTDTVLATPLVIFPPWINRFYILDLNARKSFVRWAVEQGVTVFMVSWKSADASMKDVVWDDYVRAQIDAIDHIRARLDVPAVHAIGYCVAGTTLAGTLAVLHRRGEQDKVRSATFFTAQVDFEKAGELRNFVDDQQLAAIKGLTPEGYLDGRYMAATFNLLRGTDLIWNYVVNNYLLGEDYPAFDLLHWNGDVTNLPAKWHEQYLRDFYRDNRLVEPDALSADGTPIDLGLVETPTYVQAGKEDHIAPAESVWRITDHFAGPLKFVLAGSGHIAGVVNPPGSGKYQYWTNTGSPRTLAEFRDGAQEHPGSWWPDWIEWLREQDPATVAAKGKRKPGGRGDRVIEDAPGRYVAAR
ncbi:MAG TPA: class I poly(R)-hydroxyalkanoic acid synthase [Erythrobacter sp.]|uniref:PHA/PHB synthase family protein n=1 Tax=Qipengyuania sp. R86523 TaxID=3093862 RepID=UPI000E7F361D|nr:class I poly(R)-hydroxyalkanoic acid synthase [Erythrobacter sp.]HAV80201.1 class I poly(R)-hydroxyalkanoic acid synthase [Erythrobacter sp.]HBM72737.1 class I poly(R)-hydroxyalkanoic acid synthase [Erythrobacter sp.]HBQ55261.1 class I poly(R)-hydroxyalkanoic acid synthase [Erythrobacter sp.]HCI62114.1 class I poly(R)-hydroxyalkanoic acid synthase [Erythrobacter sp.]